MKILEIGSYISVAYAGMLLAEQGHKVTKLTHDIDPIQTLEDGEKLWNWINHRKTLLSSPERTIVEIIEIQKPECIICNMRPNALHRLGIRLEDYRHTINIVHLLPEIPDQRSFDVTAQAQAWGINAQVPFYIGDTAFGLFAAFKAMQEKIGYHSLYQASCLTKLVEGELISPFKLDSPRDMPSTYERTDHGALVVYRGETIFEPNRDDEWRWQHLHHKKGRIII